MTTKKRAQGGARGKGRQRQAGRTEAADGPTPEQELIVPHDKVHHLIDIIRDGNLYEDDDAVGALLLLIHSIVFTDSGVERELYLHAAERVLLTYTGPFQEAADKLRQMAADSLKEGGE